MAKEELSWEQKEELNAQKIGIRRTVSSYYNRWGNKAGKDREVLEYYDAETLSWRPVPTNYEYHHLEKA